MSSSWNVGRIQAGRSCLGVLALFLSVRGIPTSAGTGTVQDSGRGFVVRQTRIFDGGRVLPAQDVWVAGGRIRAVGPRLRTTPGTAEIDASGNTLLPGLIDAHTHDWGESTKQALLFGVTTELNQAGRPSFVAERKRAEAEGQAFDSAALFSAGNVVTPPKGHGTEYGLTVPTLTGPGEAQAFVDARIGEGSDYIKIILEDGRACGREFARLSNEELAAAVTAAHARGKLAVVHITTQEDARIAIAAGADGIAHLFADAPPRPDVIALMARRHAFAITTLTVIQSVLGTLSGPHLLADPRVAAAVSPDAEAQMRKPMSMHCAGSLDHAFAAVRQMRDAGVAILAGTDAPAPGSWNGASLHQELELLVKAGLSPSAALAAATSVPAETFGLKDRGRIAPGLRADLLLVRGDPTRDITSTRDIVAVWKAGVATRSGTSDVAR
jgi:imidazolonepropionase-like amidohydrolase